MTTEVEIVPEVLGGKGGLQARLANVSAGLSDKLRLKVAEALLGEDDPRRYEDAVKALTEVVKNGKSSRAKLRAAALLLSHAERAAEWSLPRQPIAIQTTGPTTVVFHSMLPEEEA